MQLPFKHSAIQTTIFSVMSALAQEHQAINLSQGFPDFPIDPVLGELLNEAVNKQFNQYAPMHGLPLLREAIAKDRTKRYQVTINPETEITITPGATYGIYTAFTAILQPGDEVIVLEPAYDSYIPNIEMNGAKAIGISLVAPDFHVDWEKVRNSISAKTKAIIINTPHNPTGAVWTKHDWDQLADIVRNTNIIILSDEVYEQIIFDNKTHFSVLQHPELRQRSFAIYSFGKVCNNTGWKMGYVIAPPNLTQLFRHIHQYLAFSVNTPAQYALGHYISKEQLPSVSNLMERKRNLFLDLIKDLPFTIHQPAAGSYFQLVGYEKISAASDLDFSRWLTASCKVATIPISPFYHNKTDLKLIRFCFAKQEETLRQAAIQLHAHLI